MREVLSEPTSLPSSFTPTEGNASFSMFSVPLTTKEREAAACSVAFTTAVENANEKEDEKVDTPRRLWWNSLLS